jgi:hypothetical protein
MNDVETAKKGAESQSYWSIISERKFRAGTLFLVISAIINQLSGINAINIYSATILQ